MLLQLSEWLPFVRQPLAAQEVARDAWGSTGTLPAIVARSKTISTTTLTTPLALCEISCMQVNVCKS